MTRKEELIKVCEKLEESKKTIYLPLIEDIVFLEKKLIECRKKLELPENKLMKRQTVLSKVYKEYLQQYNNSLKNLASQFSKSGDEKGESPLRMYLRSLNA